MRNKQTYTFFNGSDVELQHVECDKEPLQCKLLLREFFGDSVAVLRHDHWVVATVCTVDLGLTLNRRET